MPADASRQTARPRSCAPTPSLPRRLPLAALMALSFAAGAQTAGEQTMAPVVVTDTAERQPDGYLATRTRVGKVEQDPHRIPQAITTVTSALMEEQQVGSLREAMRNVSGITFNAAEGGRSGDNMNLRGFYTFGDIYLRPRIDAAHAGPCCRLSA
ncbi:MAG TPA: TonB-dependent receptor plug domain-containing protein, partial [Candidatus Accumulibacter phosphatis]|nr:TonB-dependent receptor plug domain-containing protein [Candidatus Accumulibacter phosphatis]